MDQRTFDLELARRETPGCAKVMHFNNAGAALMPQPVLDAVVGHLQLEAAIGGMKLRGEKLNVSSACMRRPRV